MRVDGCDLSDLLPETQYGAAVAFSLLENTPIALECLHGEFGNDDERDLLTTQLAVGFYHSWSHLTSAKILLTCKVKNF